MRPHLVLGMAALEDVLSGDIADAGDLSGEQTLALVAYSQAISMKRIADALEKIEQHMAPRGMTYNDPHAPEDGQLPPGMDK